MSSSPSPSELQSLGALFVGFVASTVLYGLTFFQSYIYYVRYPRDSRWTKYLVAVLCILDTTASALIFEALYYYLIIQFDVNMDVLYASTTFCIQYMLSILLTFMSSLFFATRIFQVTGGSRPVTLVVIFLSFVALIFGTTTSVQMIIERRLSAFTSLHLKVTAATSQIAEVTADMIVFATMCHSLRRARYPEMETSRGFLPTSITLLVGRGLAFVVIQATYFPIFMAAPAKPFWIPLQMVASKIRINTLLAHLNSRDVRNGQGLNEEDSFAARKAAANGGFPASIRLNVTDFKATTQSVRFTTTEQGDPRSLTESSTELESGKTYHDEHGGEYTQVSITSLRSQADEDTDKTACSPETTTG